MKHILVISAYPERKHKYNDDYHLYKAKWWEDISEEDLKPYTFRWNIKEPLKKKICACSLSHKGALQKIVDENIEDCIIIEDDCICDLTRLDELNDINHFCYLGGDMRPPKLKDDKTFNKDEFRPKEKGIYQIKPDLLRILGCYGYYIPKPEIAKQILSNIPTKNKERAIDVEFCNLQKKGIINHFIYPAITTNIIHEAQQGFSNPQMNFKYDFENY
jgi:GR25 family glycosyltransferase involved in LPS biosynthesis